MCEEHKKAVESPCELINATTRKSQVVLVYKAHPLCTVQIAYHHFR